MLHRVCNQDVQRYVSASAGLVPLDCIGGLNNDYFAKLRSHNGQLISNETVIYKVERGVAISRRQPAEVVTSLSCGLRSPIHHHGALRYEA